MSSLERKRDEFRKYLENAGAIDNLTKALIKLYEEQSKPSDAVKFIRKHMCESCPDDEDFEKLNCNLDKANKKICHLERDLMRVKGSIKRTTSEVDLALTKGFEELSSNIEIKSLLKQVLTKEIVEQLKLKKTSLKGTLLDCIQSGIEILDTAIGVFACDAEAYTEFAQLFEPLIEHIHDFKKDGKQPAVDWGEVCQIPDLNDSVMFVRIECSRNVDCFPFTSNMIMEHFEEIMAKVQTVTKCMSGDLKGKFYALEGIDKDLKDTLTNERVMFPECSQLLKAANTNRFGPAGRGIFVNEANTFAVWCNQEDHLRFISLEKSANLKHAYDRLITGVTQISKNIALTRHEKYGFLTFSPENLGNTIVVSVQVKLEKLPKETDKLNEVLEKFSMKVSKPNDEKNNFYEVQNKKRLGFTEFQTVNDFAEGINALIEAENSL